MKTCYVDVYKRMKELLPEALKKDLQDNEQICEICGGLGVIKYNMPYGVEGEKRSHRGMFPYSHQTLAPCPACFNGVQRICEYCGEPIKRGWISLCDCEGYRNHEEEEIKNEWQETIARAEEVNEEDVVNMLYCEEMDSYHDSVEDFFDQWECDEHDEDDELPDRLWVTSSASMYFDADNIIEDVCSDLHEDASSACDRKELQKILDEYAEKCTGTKTYYPEYKEYVLIDWDKYLNK